MNVYSNSEINKWVWVGVWIFFPLFFQVKCSFIIHLEDRLVKCEKTPSSYNKNDWVQQNEGKWRNLFIFFYTAGERGSISLDYISMRLCVINIFIFTDMFENSSGLCLAGKWWITRQTRASRTSGKFLRPQQEPGAENNTENLCEGSTFIIYTKCI